jgi:hypothetical protein
MPHIRFKSVSDKHMKTLSKSLPKPLAQAMETTEDNFSFELMEHQYYAQGKKVKSYPFVEISWFERSQDCKTKSAKIITDQIRKLTKADDIAVVFIPIEKSDYFENGKSF